jgi:hypothetical protein
VTLRGFLKVVSVLAVALLVATLAACGSSGSDKADAPAADNTTVATPTTHKPTVKKATRKSTAKKKKSKTASATTTVPKRGALGGGTTVPGAVVIPVPAGSIIPLPPGVGVGEAGEKNNNPSSPGTTVKPFDPADGIDLSGTPGVSLAQQHAAEQFLRNTIRDLPRFSDQAVAQAAGYRTIGDAGTGDEHLINWSYAKDNIVFDSTKPEALVYSWRSGHPVLEAAMYLLKPTDRFANIYSDYPLFSSPLTQFHVHTNLCFKKVADNPEQYLVSGLTAPGGSCPSDQIKFDPVPMIHAWIVANPCGPFSALEGVGAGQTDNDVPANCDKLHAGVL